METYSEDELREAAKFTAIGEGLLNDLFAKAAELRKENQKKILIDIMRGDEQMGLYDQ